LKPVKSRTKSLLLDGLKFEESPEKTASNCDDPIEQRSPSDSPVLVESQPAKPDPIDVEAALVRALEGAAAAQRWDVVAQLAKELEARRVARTSLLDCGAEI